MADMPVVAPVVPVAEVPVVTPVAVSNEIKVPEAMDSIKNILFPSESPAEAAPIEAAEVEQEVKEEPIVEDVKTDEPPVEEVKKEEPVTPSKFKLDLGEGEKEYAVDDIKNHYLRSKEKEAVAMKKFNEAYKMNMENREAIVHAQKVLELINSPEQSLELVKYLMSKHPDQKATKMQAISLLEDILSEESMDPKDKQIRDLQRQAQDRELNEQNKAQKLKQEQEQAQKVQVEKDTEVKMGEWATKIHNAIEKDGLPATNQIYSMVTYYCGLQKEQGIPVDPVDVMPLVRRDLKVIQKAVLEGADEKTLADLATDKLMAKVREMDRSRVKVPSTNVTKPAIATKENVAKVVTQNKPMSEEERLSRLFFQSKKR